MDRVVKSPPRIPGSRMLHPLLAGVLGCVMLAGCAGAERAETSRMAQTSLVGMPKEVLLSCAGVPSRQAVSGGREFMTYWLPGQAGGGSGTSIGIGAGGGGGGGGIGLGLGFGIPLGGGSTQGCEATFTIGPDGRVERLAYHPDSTLAACEAVIRNCVPPNP